MNRIYSYFPDVDLDEAAFLENLLKDKSEDDIRNFAAMYRSRRRDPQLIMLTSLAGFIWIAGIHRFLLNQIGMGILYLFTGGLCFIGTIVDLVNYKSMALEYNQKVAMEVVMLMR